MSLSVSVSNFSNFLSLSSGIGELVWGICWVVVSSQSDSNMHRHLGHFSTQVRQYGPTKFAGHSGSLEFPSCPVPSVMFKSFNAIVASESCIGSFSLSELVFLGLLKTLGVYSSSPPTWTHAPESNEDPESCTFFNEMGSTLFVGPILTHWVCFSHGLYFSVLLPDPLSVGVFPILS